MPLLTRRSFLAATAAGVAAPAIAAPAPVSEFDVIVVGAGAAGIAAGRRLAAANRKFVILEASDRVGGRCFTDTTTFGVRFDRGAHWIHTPEINPVSKVAPSTGLDIYPAPPGQKIKVGRRYAREGEMEDFLAHLVRANRAISDAAKGKADVACAQTLPKDLGDWRPTVDFVLGPFACGKDLSDVSAMDFAKSAERDVVSFCRQGFGTLVTRLADGLPVRLASPVTRIETYTRRGVEVYLQRGMLTARGVIVTISTEALLAGKIKIDPEPRRQLDAASKLRLGAYDRIVLELSGNPMGLLADDLVYEKAQGARTAAMLANVGGSNLCMIDVAGSFGRDLAAQGDQAMVAFAGDWLAGLYGSDLRKAIRRSASTRWAADPWALGAFSAAAVGGQGARKTLSDPLRNKVWFAGEAAHETLWGTVGGAWESGESTAEALMRHFGFIASPPESKRPAAARPKPPVKRVSEPRPGSAAPLAMPDRESR